MTDGRLQTTDLFMILLLSFSFFLKIKRLEH